MTVTEAKDVRVRNISILVCFVGICRLDASFRGKAKLCDYILDFKLLIGVVLSQNFRLLMSPLLLGALQALAWHHRILVEL